MAQSLQQDQQMRYEQQPPSFASNVLPVTMGLAHGIRIVLSQQVSTYPCSWPFADRVLAWLLPEMQPDIARFHKDNGPTLMELFQHHQLESIDRGLFRQLVHWLNNSEPTLLPMVLDIIAAIKQSEHDPRHWHEELSTVRLST